MKKSIFLIIMVVIILIAAFTLRILSGDEDAWVCDQGDWVEHGHPDAPRPSTLCVEDKINLENETIKEVEPIIGGDRDEHGCLGPAGYTWCEAKQECLRVWEDGCEVTVLQPQPDNPVSSPLLVKGEAKGNWFFEAVIPIKLVDKDNNVILSSYGQANGEWMTEDFVSFETVIDFNTTATSGYLIIEKNNPSDLREFDALFRVPVKFQ